MKNDTLISVKNIIKTYDTGEVKITALRGVSLEIKQEDFLIITGRNGSGKSTFLHQIALLDLPDCGEIYLNGKDVTKMKERERSNLRLRYLGYIFQEYALIAELSVLENVMLPAMMIKSIKASRKTAEGLLAKVGLEQKSTHLPSQLSGGEQQKVAIARALVNNPMVLIADEPTANLDSIAAKDVLETFKKLSTEDKHTIIMVTHEPEETTYANRLVHFADGRIV